jgi:Voltage gated chloride channel
MGQNVYSQNQDGQHRSNKSQQLEDFTRNSNSRFGLETIRGSVTSFGDISDVGGSPLRQDSRSGLYGTMQATFDNSDESHYNVSGDYLLSQQDQIRKFSLMVQHASNLDRNASPAIRTRKIELPPPPPPLSHSEIQHNKMTLPTNEADEDSESDISFDEQGDNARENNNGQPSSSLMSKFQNMINPTEFLMSDAKYDENGNPFFNERNYTVAAFVRYFFYNPITPEFTALQQFDWAVIIGIVMGFYTAMWQWYIDSGVDFWWSTVPEHLYNWGVFTEIDGRFPLYHYMWILPSVFSSALSFLFVVLETKIPTQDSWIKNVHSLGVQDHRTFFPLFFLSTCGLWSGLSLGPELPLVLTGGMAGSWLAIITKQSVLQARVMNLTAASAAISGFFGFPMAGALFVLEL